MTRSQRRREQRRKRAEAFQAPASAAMPADTRTAPRASYHAVGNKHKRAVAPSLTRNEDAELKPADRRKLKNTVLDQVRNFSLIAWAVRQVTNYNTRFSFQCRTEDEALNNRIEAYIEGRKRARVFDAARRQNLDAFLRTSYRCMLADGDAWPLKLADGSIQGIEGDRIGAPTQGALPKGIDLDRWSHGIRYDERGRPVSLMICKRAGRMLEYERTVDYDRAIPMLELERFDQGRGVSPLVSAVNAAQDLYEASEAYALKSKLVAWAGMIIKRGDHSQNLFKLAAGGGASAGEDSEDGRTDYEVETNGKPFMLDMDPGDSLEVVESKTPPSEFIAHTGLLTRVILLALDIPYTFYDHTRGSYTIQKDAWTLWELNSQPKRDLVEVWLDNWAYWQLARGIASGEVALPAGLTLPTLPWEWVHQGRPWMDARELSIDIDAIKMGLVAAPDVIRKHGGEPTDIVAKNRIFYRALRDASLPTKIWDDGQVPVIYQEGSTDA